MHTELIIFVHINQNIDKQLISYSIYSDLFANIWSSLWRVWL